MTDDQPTRPDDGDRTQGQEDQQPRIPDGGLSSAMPEWLRQPPAWKRPAVQTRERSLPDPDSSVIDPASLVDVENLPRWLRELAAASSQEPAAVPVESRPFAQPPSDEESAVASPLEGEAHLTAQHEDVVETRRNRHVAEEPESELVPFRHVHQSYPWWLSNVAIAILFTAIVVTLIYVLLEAAGVL